MPAAKKQAAAPAKAAAPAAKPAPGKAVAKATPAPSASLAVMDDDMLNELLDDAGAGLEGASASDYALPFVYLMQKMSPQVDKAEAKYIEGAEAGQFLNTLTGEILDELLVIPVHFDKVYIEWVPRDAGGGFVGQYETRQEADANCAEGNQIVDTANHYVLLWSPRDETWSPAIVSMTSTKLKASRSWVSKMSMVTISRPGGKKVQAPTYAKYYKILPDGPVKNEKGTFYIVKVEAVEGEDGWVKDAELRDQAKNFRAALQAGTKGADYTKAVDAEVVDVEDEAEPKY